MKKEKLCKMIKTVSVEEEFATFAEIVKPAKFICSKCGRAAKKDKFLCNPLALPKKNKNKKTKSVSED